MGRTIDEVTQTVTRMREFYRGREPQQNLEPVALNQIVPQVIELTRARWSDMALHRSASIEVCCDLASELPLIAGIESEHPGDHTDRMGQIHGRRRSTCAFRAGSR